PIVIAVLVVTCPCALGHATPTALTAATGALSRLGLLVTRGHALETLARATHFVFDKTGTLTRGELRVSRLRPLADVDIAYCLGVAAALEARSEHPIARAIMAAARSGTTQAVGVVNAPGEGLRGAVDGETFYLGTTEFVAQRTSRQVDAATLADMRGGGGTVVVLATPERLLAAFVLEDTLRPGAAELVAELNRRGKRVVLLTGDHAEAAHHVA